MKENFFRRPVTTTEWMADGLRAMAVLGILVAALVFSPTDVGIVALASPAVMLPRILGMRAGFDLAHGAIVLVAAWSNVFGLYTSVPRWDLAVHMLCTGVLSLIAYVCLARAGVLPDLRGGVVRRRVPAFVVPIIALAISALWEMLEWAGWRYISDTIYVAYQDTIGDMILGALGGVVAGMLLAVVRVERADATPAALAVLPAGQPRRHVALD
ncbi:hypothetical protein GCM10022219_11300 [Microbacterium oryzae]|uniref:hypothetical protein n=1 Tax=Microbacterium oryzae TaxID=743009 RepID=UPI001C12B6DA|nr:hypothetical protein [Microbacterium oryzae]